MSSRMNTDSEQSEVCEVGPGLDSFATDFSGVVEELREDDVLNDFNEDISVSTVMDLPAALFGTVSDIGIDATRASF